MFQKKLFYNLLLFGSLKVEKYRLSCNIQDRYVQSEIAVHVKNTGNEDIEYNFGVKLDENEFISGLTMRVGDKGNLFAPPDSAPTCDSQELIISDIILDPKKSFRKMIKTLKHLNNILESF